ncbi:beta-galactosidase [Enterococcus sp. JM9B]|uniref:beta-galactosidase n=1 Tax=Enterococcus sp. JM9B TaxID=1857216 RepID=UPI001374B8D9|nr:beta-galactosidase [Enterococcus sp. JM9B]KAF1301880.1 glycoside hydrolase family 42 [Enterococcus sp. JM9B]
MNVILAGDSTVMDQTENFAPAMGWGQALKELLREKNLSNKVINFARYGASAKSFEENGFLKALLERVEKDDLVLIQFGRNGQGQKNDEPLKEYYKRLKKWVHVIEKIGGKPILCTPVERHHFINGHQVHTLVEYTSIIQHLAKEEEIPFLDLNSYSNFLYEALGEKKSAKLFTQVSPIENNTYSIGILDNDHFCQKGAFEIARYVFIKIQHYLKKDEIFDKYYYGACMYPEVWSREILEEDIRHMKELKMNFARIGEFIWSSLEPEEGVYDFSLVTKALDLYRENDIDVCLCIPTPTPPRWMTYNHEERLIKNIDGTYMVHGSRQHVCTNNAYFRKKANQLTQKIAQLAEQYDNVIAIQLDNEFKCHVDLCYCDTCNEKWHEWLRKEYLEIDHLNNEWGTKIWSEEYSTFDEVVMPMRTPFLHNSSLMNAFRKFTAESLNEFAHGLCHHIRMETDIPITHNSALGFNLLNEELFSELDVAGFDTYQPHTTYSGYLLNLDIWRNMKKNSNEMLLLETSTSHVGHLEDYVVSHPVGYLPIEVFIGFASGLKSFNYWHFRGHRYGVEQTHSCVVTAWGEPDRGYGDVVKSGELIEKLSPLLKESFYKKSNIAMVYSDHAKRMYTIETGGMYAHRSLVTKFYTSLVHAGITTEVIQENADFDSYDLILVPFVRNITPTMLAKCKQFVESGGKLIFGPMTGDRTKELTWPKKNGLDRLGDWLGLHGINQFRASAAGKIGTYQKSSAELDGLVTTFEGNSSWTTLSQTEFGETIVAKKVFETGSVIYIGAIPQSMESEYWSNFISNEVLSLDQNRYFIQLGDGLAQYRRETDTTIVLYIANMTGNESNFELLKKAHDLLSGKEYLEGNHVVNGYEYRVLSFKK